MNTDIHFQISAPASLSIFGEHAKNKLRASIDLRTTLIFKEVPASLRKDITIRFPQINLLHKISLKEIFTFYNNCEKNMKILHEIVSKFTFQYYESINQKIFLQIFYYLIASIKYKKQFEIKPFTISLTTHLIPNGEFMSLASLKVCLVACLLHWSRLQKGSHISTFDEIDLDNIINLTSFCEKLVPESNSIDIMVCTCGLLMKYEEEHDRYELHYLPSKTILLVDSNQRQDVEAQKQQVAELMTMFPELANSILNTIDIVTNMAYNIFKKISDIYQDSELSIEMKNDCLLQQHKALEVSRNMNSIKKCCRIVYIMYSCVFCVIFFHEFYLRTLRHRKLNFTLMYIYF